MRRKGRISSSVPGQGVSGGGSPSPKARLAAGGREGDVGRAENGRVATVHTSRAT